MSVKLYAITCGWLTMPLGAMLRGEKGRLKVPVPVFLIDHPRGKVLFDSGVNPAALTGGDDYLGANAKFMTLHVEPADTLTEQLARIEIDPGDIDYLVNSHLHFDHAGGNQLVSDAPILIQEPELVAARRADPDQPTGYLAEDYETGQDFRLLQGEYDVFGDGSVVCLPTYGHTAGHQSLKLRLDSSAEVILAGDACYLRRTLDEMHLPFIVADEAAMLDSLKKLKALQARGARIFYGHDPDFWADMPMAPQAIG